MKNKLLLGLIAILAISFIVTSCEYEIIEPEITPTPDPGPFICDTCTTPCDTCATPCDTCGTGGDDPTVFFATDIAPIFENNCASCHTLGHYSGVELTPDLAYNSINNATYINITAPETSFIYTIQKNGHESLSSPDDAKLLTWITEGALNN